MGSGGDFAVTEATHNNAERSGTAEGTCERASSLKPPSSTHTPVTPLPCRNCWQ